MTGNKIKVVFISSANQGSISPIVRSQGESLRREGVSVEYFGVEGTGILGYLRNVPRFRKLVRRVKPDLIHAHYGLSAVVALIGKNRNHKLVVSFMGDDILGSREKSGNITVLSKMFSKINNLLSFYCYDYSILKSLEMSKKLLSKRKAIIPNGVDLGIFNVIEKNEARQALNLQKNMKLIVFISNPKRAEKNFDLAVKAVEKLKDDNVFLKPIFNKIHEEVNLYLNAADILILTSFHEGSPNVIKEAMACNCPVVATDV
ncbi:MAG: glycosyltransferase, partial [Chitinophagaceae bacterium]|nr:glycosyltransferase [Chitinophagaceae bacterium]